MSFFEFLALCFVSYASYVARYSSLIVPDYRTEAFLACAPVLSVAALFFVKGYKSAARYQSPELDAQYALALSVATVVWGFVIYVFGAKFPRSIIIIYWLASIFVIISWRRILAITLTSLFGKASLPRDRRAVLVLGAGPVGVQLVRALRQQGYYRPLAFIDDEKNLRHRRVLGLTVYGVHEIRDVLEKLGARELLIAKPEMRRDERRDLIRSLNGLSLVVKVVPGLSELARGRWKATEVRDIAVEELLGRDPVKPSESLAGPTVEGRSILITGAGGSIGSELARQIALFQPSCLVLMDVSEFALFQVRGRLTQDLRAANITVETHYVVGSIADEDLVRRTMRALKVAIVFHAAAYKHVGLVEDNVVSAVKNNVFGTQSFVECAKDCGVSLFVLVSTDKAVRPTSVMGATKRVAELVVQAAASSAGTAVFTMVRFGNVLGSSGSVVPIFQEQIRKGGPVTVTHPDVTRYFMLIPEAAQLVIQAGGMAQGGEVFLLDMGEPVKIYDLARTMINLAGFDVRDEACPGGEIAIQFTGLKSGEKLYEELLIDNQVLPTLHERIFKSDERFLSPDDLDAFLTKLRSLVDKYDEGGIRTLLSEVVNGKLSMCPPSPKTEHNVLKLSALAHQA